MSLDMLGTVGQVFDSRRAATAYVNQVGYYDYANGGIWVEPDVTPIDLGFVTVQGASGKSMEMMVNAGGTTNPRDVRVVYINTGQMLYPADTGRNADELAFDDGLGMRRWRVKFSDPRPWRNYCKAIVERMPAEDA